MLVLVGLVILVLYLVITLACLGWAYRWAAGRKFGIVGKSATLAGVLSLAFAIPFGDHVAGYAYFSHLCRTESGTNIYRTATGVEGLWWSPATAQTLRDLGYRFIEGGVDPEKVTRYEARDGSIVVHKDVRTTSRYAFLPGNFEEVGWGIIRGRDWIVRDTRTGETLTETIGFQYRGGWLIRPLVAGFGGIAAKCSVRVDPKALLKSVLRPTL